MILSRERGSESGGRRAVQEPDYHLSSLYLAARQGVSVSCSAMVWSFSRQSTETLLRRTSQTASIGWTPNHKSFHRIMTKGVFPYRFRYRPLSRLLQTTVSPHSRKGLLQIPRIRTDGAVLECTCSCTVNPTDTCGQAACIALYKGTCG